MHDRKISCYVENFSFFLVVILNRQSERRFFFIVFRMAAKDDEVVHTEEDVFKNHALPVTGILFSDPKAVDVYRKKLLQHCESNIQYARAQGIEIQDNNLSAPFPSN